MQLTEQQVLALAPDSGSANNGKKLAAHKHWPLLGRSGRALWGECQGSGSKPYQVRLDIADYASKCSCPSFKFPCKHALGLLLLAASQPALLAEGSEPEWVGDWLDKRSETAAKKEAKAIAKAEAPVDEAAQQKRAEKRDNRVKDGLAAFQVWLEDLMRNGLARLPAEGPAIWEQQAARLVDAQAGGLAARVRVLGDLVGSTSDWPARLLAELGRLALAIRAYERIEHLPESLQHTLRLYLGFAMREDEVLVSGEALRERWQVIGQATDDTERVRVQRTWLQGEASGRHALLLQFAVGAQPFGASWLAGTAFEGELVFWPGATLRALLKGSATPLPSPSTFFHAQTIAQLLEHNAASLANNPWLERVPVVLAGAIPVVRDGIWSVAQADGQSLPLAVKEDWLWLALSGGHPADLAAEWDGRAIRPLGVFIAGAYHPLAGAKS